MTNQVNKSAIIPAELYGERVDVALAKLFPEYSRSQLSQWLKEGMISLNSKQLKPKDKVQGGESVILSALVSNSNETHLAENIDLNIIFEDDNLLVINKPAGLVVHPGAGNPSHTLVNGLLHYLPQLQTIPRAGIIHRLDKDTTGLLIVAKTLVAHTALIRMMQMREIQRHYTTLVYGHIISGKRIETFYGRHPRNRLKMAVLKQGREAITEFSVKKQYGFYTLLQVSLLTGRTHQIRVHMDYLNHPVVGDPLYGGRLKIPPGASTSLKEHLCQFKRQALHAEQLIFIHPFTQQELTMSAPLPDDFQVLLNMLDEHESISS